MGNEADVKEVEQGQEEVSYEDAWQEPAEEPAQDEPLQEEDVQDEEPSEEHESAPKGDPASVVQNTSTVSSPVPPETPEEPEWKTELAKIRAENETLKRQVEEVAKKPPEGIPVEDMPEDYAEFAKQYPELAHMARENSPIGRGIRNRLENLGVEDAAEYAAPALEVRKAKERESFVARQEEEKQASAQAMADWQAKVFVAVPELHAAMQAGNGNKFVSEVETWAKSKPYEEASSLLAIIDSGSAEQTIALLNRFKAEKSQQKGAATKKAADAMAAVPGHPNPLGIRQEGKKDDYDRAWEEG